MGDPFNCNFSDSTLEIVGKPWVSISRLVLDSTSQTYGGTLTLILQVSEAICGKRSCLQCVGHAEMATLLYYSNDVNSHY